ncbi:hypothetical protein GCM10027280_41690 [Micromonospora polyrhachis]
MVAALAALWPLTAPGPAAAAEPCSRGRAEGTGPAPGVPWERQWLDLDRVWAMTGTAPSVLVAVVDTGVDRRHPQLRGGTVTGTDLVDGGDGSTDCTGHGTAIASLIGARHDRTVAFAGIAPQTRILPVRVAERIDDDMNPRLVAAGVDWAVSRGAQIVVMAYTLPADSQALRAAVARAVARGVLVVASAGLVANGDGPQGPPVPAIYPGVLGVSAVNGTGSTHEGTLPGSHVDLAAPGADVTAAAPVRGHTNYSSPDMAAAITAGVAALVWADHRDADAVTVVRRLTATADPSPGGWGSPSYGAGILNPVRALSEPIATAENRAATGFTPVAAPTEPNRAPGLLVGVGFAIAALGALGIGILRRARRRATVD